jgi:DNA-binding MarR family transcriptional regulator
VSQPTATARTLEELSAELVLYTGRLVRAITRQSAGLAVDVPTAQLRLLSQVDELGPVTIGALAAADRCSQPTMSAGVQVLCERGWAVKAPNPADARSSLVSLTDAGRTVLTEARRERAAVVAARLRSDPRHDERDLATAVAVLRGLLDQPDHDEGAA